MPSERGSREPKSPALLRVAPWHRRLHAHGGMRRRQEEPSPGVVITGGAGREDLVAEGPGGSYRNWKA